MGWTQTWERVEARKADVLRFFYGDTGDHFTYTKVCWRGGEQVTEVAASALVGTAFYAVIRFKTPTRPEFGAWFGAVYKIGFGCRMDGSGFGCRMDGSGFGYKDMTENMGPGEATAPLHVLKVLEEKVPHPVLSPEVQAETALIERDLQQAQGRTYLALEARWRDLDPDRSAREWRAACRTHHARAAQARQLTPGTRLRFRTPLRFQGGRTLDTFTVATHRRQRVFQGDDGGLYRITDWKERAFEVLRGQAPAHPGGVQPHQRAKAQPTPARPASTVSGSRDGGRPAEQGHHP
jgi:hypothetical protein